MNVKQLIRLLTVILYTTFLIKILGNSAIVEARSIHGEATGRDQILNASVQISMSVFTSRPGESQSNSKTTSNKVIANGIGTLIDDRGKVLIVTHNHWGEALQDVSLVELRHAGNELLLRMFGFEFKERIRFQDAGTLILEAPEQIASSRSQDPIRSAPRNSIVPGLAGDSAVIKPGESVQVVYRGSEGRQKIEILEAEVMAIDSFKGLPVFKLRSLSGHPLQQGDSGGGVWFRGQLVGNTWATLVTSSRAEKTTVVGNERESEITYTDLSIAATLPLWP